MHSRGQRIAAWVGIILLVLLYVAALIFAIFDFDKKGALFRASLLAAIAVPILIWVYIRLYGLITNKHTITSTDYDFTAGMTQKTDTDEIDGHAVSDKTSE